MNQEILDSFEYKTIQGWYDYLKAKKVYLIRSLKSQALRHHALWESMGLVIPESMTNRLEAIDRLISEQGCEDSPVGLSRSESAPDAV